MITVEPQPDNSGEIRLTFQEDNAMGNFYAVNMDDHQGLKLWLEMGEFYAKKGHNMPQLLEVAKDKPSLTRRLWQAFIHVIGG